jgi:hypothetical protein
MFIWIFEDARNHKPQIHWSKCLLLVGTLQGIVQHVFKHIKQEYLLHFLCCTRHHRSAVRLESSTVTYIIHVIRTLEAVWSLVIMEASCQSGTEHYSIWCHIDNCISNNNIYYFVTTFIPPSIFRAVGNMTLFYVCILLLPLALQPAVSFGLSNNTPPFFPICHQLCPSYHSQYFEDLFLLLLSIFSWVFLFVSSLPVIEWRSYWASYPLLFSPGDPTNLSFVPLSILLYFILYSALLVLDSSYFSIPHLHV